MSKKIVLLGLGAGLLVLAIGAVTLLPTANDPASRPPCRPLADSDIEALEDRFWAAKRATLEVMEELDRMHDAAWETHYSVKSGDYISTVAEGTAREIQDYKGPIEELKEDLAFGEAGGRLASTEDYLARIPYCEQELSDEYFYAQLRGVKNVWLEVAELEKDVWEAEQGTAILTREMERVRALLELSTALMEEARGRQ